MSKHNKKGLVVKILDTVTGKTHQSDSGYSLLWWAEGNGSCDCNRVPSDKIEQELDDKFGEGNCYGNTRFLIIDIISEGSEIIIDKNEAIKAMNEGYPLDLMKMHLKNVHF